MGEETTRVEETTLLEDEIRRERAGLADSIQALEDKAHRAGDWRYQFAKRPVIGLGIAFAGGLALGRLVTNGHDDSDDDYEEYERNPDRQSKTQARSVRNAGLLAGLQGALASVAAQELRRYLRNRLLSTNDSSDTPDAPAPPAAPVRAPRPVAPPPPET